MRNQSNNLLHILFVWRLEKEKWIELLLEVINRIASAPEIDKKIIWNIVGEWSFLESFRKLSKSNINIFGQKSKNELLDIRKHSDIAIIPSIFLETFGLVWLESLSAWIPVIGFKKGWLTPFVSDALMIDWEDPADSIQKIIKWILEWNINLTLPDILDFSLNSWQIKLKKLVGNSKKILLVSDYLCEIWWAEQYFFFLKWQLEDMGIQVEVSAFSGTISPLTRKVLFVSSFIAFWRWLFLYRKIKDFKPDIVWWHSLLRYQGIWGILAFLSAKKTYMTHHDFWFISPRPSMIFTEKDLPIHWSIHEFIKNSNWLPEKLLRIFKYIYLSLIWKFLSSFDLHIVPADFMKPYFEKLSHNSVKVFQHTNF